MAVKSIKFVYTMNKDLTCMMDIFRQMVNECIRLGIESNISTLKRLSSNHYKDLQKYDIQSKYKLTAMSQACKLLKQRKSVMKKGENPRYPYVRKPYLVSYKGFKITGNLLSIPIKNNPNSSHYTDRSFYVNVLLPDYVKNLLENKQLNVKSFVITKNFIGLSVHQKIDKIVPENIIGIDRNLRNVTISTINNSIMYKTNKLFSIKENTSHVVSSFSRNDRRVKSFFLKRLGNRRSRRVQQYLHKISKDIVKKAKESKSLIVFENLKGMQKLYRKGNGQGNKFRRRLNSWSFYELQRQIEYKAEWEGIPIDFVDPKRTSQLCPICGDRLQEDRLHSRKLLCNNCKKSMDRDVIASMNIAYKGWSRFCHPRGLPIEAVKRNMEHLKPLILRVDGSKLKIQKNDTHY